MREVMLVIHFIGLAMGIGTGFAHAFLGSVAAGMEAKEATKFRLHTLVLSKMGIAGITLLGFSGLGLMNPYWQILFSSPLLMAKLFLVILLIGVISRLTILGKRAQKENPAEQFKKMKTLGKISIGLGLAIIIVAVSFFH